VARLADRMVADDLGRVPVVERDRKAYYMRPKRTDTPPL
jgi:hypothetical protein